MRFRVRYGDPDALLSDFEQQYSRGGFLVRVSPPPGLALFTEADLIVEYADQEVLLQGQVVQVIDGVGVAVGVVPGARLDPLLEAARARTGGGGPPPTHALEEESRASGAQRVTEAYERHRSASTMAEKIKMARYGGKDERMMVMRGGEHTLHRFVIQNPGLGLDEVKAIAGMSTLSADILKAIAERSEWASRPDIALTLVRNPKTPVPIALKLLSSVSAGDLRQLAKSNSVRMPILKAARKRVIGE